MTPAVKEDFKYPRRLRKMEQFDGEFLPTVAMFGMRNEPFTLTDLVHDSESRHLKLVAREWIASAEWRGWVQPSEPSARRRQWRVTEEFPDTVD